MLSRRSCSGFALCVRDILVGLENLIPEIVKIIWNLLLFVRGE